jgi:hypothetical protein
VIVNHFEFKGEFIKEERAASKEGLEFDGVREFRVERGWRW